MVPIFWAALGVFVVEIGWVHGEDVKRLFEEAGAHDVTVVQDLGLRDRVVTGYKPA